MTVWTNTNFLKPCWSENNSCVVKWLSTAPKGSVQHIWNKQAVCLSACLPSTQDVAPALRVTNSLLIVYLLWALETDPALGGPQAAGRAGQRHGVQAHLQPGLLVLKSQAPGPRVAAVVLLLVIPGMAVDERRPTAASHPQTSHGGGPSICVWAGLSRIGSHKHQDFQFIKKHADPILEHVGLHKESARLE